MALQQARSLSSRPTSPTSTRQLYLDIPYPEAIDQRVSQAVSMYRTKARLKVAAERPPCAEVAAKRIRGYFMDLGRELSYTRWMAEVARQAGMNYTTVRAIIHGTKTRVGPDVVDQIVKSTGCPVAVFYDYEF